MERLFDFATLKPEENRKPQKNPSWVNQINTTLIAIAIGKESEITKRPSVPWKLISKNRNLTETTVFWNYLEIQGKKLDMYRSEFDQVDKQIFKKAHNEVYLKSTLT